MSQRLGGFIRLRRRSVLNFRRRKLFVDFFEVFHYVGMMKGVTSTGSLLTLTIDLGLGAHS